MKRLSGIFCITLLFAGSSQVNAMSEQTDVMRNDSITQGILIQADSTLKNLRELLKANTQQTQKGLSLVQSFSIQSPTEKLRLELVDAIKALITESPEKIMGPEADRKILKDKALEVIRTTLEAFNNDPKKAREFFEPFDIRSNAIISDLVAEHYSNQLLEKMDSASVQEMNAIFLNFEANLSEMFQIQRNLTKKLFDKALTMEGSDKEGLSETRLNKLQLLTREWEKNPSDNQNLERNKGLSESVLNAYRDAYEGSNTTMLSNAKALIENLGNRLSQETLKEITSIILETHFINNTFGTDAQAFEHLSTISKVCGSEVMLKNLQDIFKDQKFSNNQVDLRETVKELNATIETFKTEKKLAEKRTILDRFKNGIESIKNFITQKFNTQTKQIKSLIDNSDDIEKDFEIIKSFIDERAAKRDFGSIADLLKTGNNWIKKNITILLVEQTPEVRIKIMKKLPRSMVESIFKAMEDVANSQAQIKVDTSIKTSLKQALTQNTANKIEQMTREADISTGTDEMSVEEETSTDKENQTPQEVAETSFDQPEPERTSTREQRIESNKEIDERKAESERRARQEGEKARETKTKGTERKAVEEVTYSL